MKSYVRSIPFSEKDVEILKLSALRVVAFSQRTQKGETSIATFWISSAKNVVLIA